MAYFWLLPRQWPVLGWRVAGCASLGIENHEAAEHGFAVWTLLSKVFSRRRQKEKPMLRFTHRAIWLAFRISIFTFPVAVAVVLNGVRVPFRQECFQSFDLGVLR
jgi:hypothetical protein